MLPNSESLTNILWYSAILGTVVFVLKTFLPITDFGEVGGDFNSITDGDGSFHLFTLESVAAFFMCGGWVGYIALDKLDYKVKIALVCAVVAGIVGMVFFTWLIALVKKLEQVPKQNLEDLVGKVGKSYLKFSPKGTSKIEIEFCGRLQIMDATSLSDVEISSFEVIKVVKVENNIVYIEKN